MWAPALACAYVCVLRGFVELCVFPSLSVSVLGGVCREACVWRVCCCSAVRAEDKGEGS